MPSGFRDAAPYAVDDVAALAPDKLLFVAFAVDGVTVFVAFTMISLADNANDGGLAVAVHGCFE